MVRQASYDMAVEVLAEGMPPRPAAVLRLEALLARLTLCSGWVVPAAAVMSI